jgi:hypothetical protein
MFHQKDSRRSYFWINILNWCCRSTWTLSHTLMESSLILSIKNIDSPRIFIYERLWFSGSFVLKWKSIRTSTDNRVLYHCLWLEQFQYPRWPYDHSSSWLCLILQGDLGILPIIISYVLDESQRSFTSNNQEEHICFFRLNSGSENVTSISKFYLQ